MLDLDPPEVLVSGKLRAKKTLVIGGKLTAHEIDLVKTAAPMARLNNHAWCQEQLKNFYDNQPLLETNPDEPTSVSLETYAERILRFRGLLDGLKPEGNTVCVQTRDWAVNESLNVFSHDLSVFCGQTISKTLLFRYLLAHGARLVFGLPPEDRWLVSPRRHADELAQSVSAYRLVVDEMHALEVRPAEHSGEDEHKRLDALRKKRDALYQRQVYLRDTVQGKSNFCAKVWGLDTFSDAFDALVPKLYNLNTYFDANLAGKYATKRGRKTSLLPMDDPSGLLQANDPLGTGTWEPIERAVERHLRYGYSLPESILRAKLEVASRLTLTHLDGTPDERVQAMYLDANGEPLPREGQLERLRIEREAKALPPPLSQTEQAATTLPATPTAPAISQLDAFPEIRFDEEESWSSEN
jgi:hypothetical protein